MSDESQAGGEVTFSDAESLGLAMDVLSSDLVASDDAVVACKQAAEILSRYLIRKTGAPTLQAACERVAAALHWQQQKIPTVGAGYVRYVDHAGSDEFIVEAARTSSNRAGRSVADDVKLLRYLVRHRHTTPIEFGQLTVEIYAPMDVIRQHIRHRMSSTSEYSTRYSPAVDEAHVTPPGAWRKQATSNRQGSEGFCVEWPEGWSVEKTGDDTVTVHMAGGEDLHFAGACAVRVLNEGVQGLLSLEEGHVLEFTREVYERRLKLGVASEQARKDLPLATYTRLYWTIDLHNLMHYLGLRLDSHAQYEIRQLANGLWRLVQQFFPQAAKAFEDYRLRAVTLNGPERDVLQQLLAQAPELLYTADGADKWLEVAGSTASLAGDTRAQQEGLTKLRLLGFFGTTKTT